MTLRREQVLYQIQSIISTSTTIATTEEKESKTISNDLNHKMIQQNNLLTHVGKSLEMLAPPFQTLQFLVRDWNEFEDLEPEDLQGEENMKKLEQNMTDYLKSVLSTTDSSNKDLVSVRKHINDCFETVDAFLLPHPGFEVVKKSYDGDFGKIRNTFKQLMRHYVHALFEERLAPKCIHGAYVTANELLQYVKAYTKVFCEAKAFPGKYSNRRCEQCSCNHR